MNEKPTLYTIDGTPVEYPYIIPEPVEVEPVKTGIEPPFLTDDTLVFKCNEYTVKSKPYKHYYMNKIHEKTGIHRVTDKKSRKQLTEYYLEEIQIKNPSLMGTINVYTREVTTQDWLQSLIPATTFILTTRYGDRLSIPARAVFEQNVFAKYAYITTTAYKPEFIKTVISSITEFLLLTINRVYTKYGQELYNFLHGQPLSTQCIIIDAEVIRDEENNTSTLKGKLYDQRTLETIPLAEVTYTILETGEEETETITDGEINKIYNIHKQLYHLLLTVNAGGYDTSTKELILVDPIETNTQITNNPISATIGETIKIPIMVTDEDNENVPTGVIEVYQEGIINKMEE